MQNPAERRAAIEKIEAMRQDPIGRYGVFGDAWLMKDLHKLDTFASNGRVSLALLTAAVAQCKDGEDARAQVNDPASGEPFAFDVIGDGFCLTSEASIDGKPITMTVGTP